MGGDQMRRKVSTLLEEQLYLRVKLEAVRNGKQISEILGLALARYLDESDVPEGAGSVVEKTRGILKISASQLKAVVEEEDDYLGA